MPWEHQKYSGENTEIATWLVSFNKLSFLGPTKPNYYCIPDTAFASFDDIKQTSEESDRLDVLIKIIQDMTRLDPKTRPLAKDVVTRLQNIIWLVEI